MTHKQLATRASNWLRYNRHLHCSVVATELTTANHETPDVIGWYGGGGSILIECKASRSDFHADKSKSFRREEESGMGDQRYYLAPKGVLTPTDLPEGWGLLEVDDRCVREIVAPVHKAADKKCEVKMLMSMLRRLEISTAVFVRQEDGFPVDSDSVP